MLLSKFFNSYLNTRKKNVVIKISTYKNLSLNVEIQTKFLLHSFIFDLYYTTFFD